MKTKNPIFRRAIYPGSFDPITLGHVDIIRRISALYEEVVVLVAQSNDKISLFTAVERRQLIKKSLGNLPNVRIEIFEGLTVDFVKKEKGQVIVRGLRAVTDFEYEVSQANINRQLNPEIETVLVFASPEYYFISSRAVKEVVKNGGDPKGLVPAQVIGPLKTKLQKNVSRGKNK